MSRIHTITYDQAKKWFDSGRKYKPIGTKLTKNIWLNYDEANDRYTLAYTHSKCYEIINEQGEKQYKKAGADERDKYTQEFIGFVYRDHAHIFHPTRLTDSTRTARNFFESYFNCTYRKTPGVKMKGFEWTFFHEGLSYWARTHGAGEVKLSGARVMIKPAAPGTGIIAGGVVRQIIGVTGITNLLSKSLGSTNKVNIAYATIEALKSQVPREQWLNASKPAAKKTVKAAKSEGEEA